MSNIGFALFHRTNRYCSYVWGRAIKIEARPFWGRGVFVLVFSNVNIGLHKLLTPQSIAVILVTDTVMHVCICSTQAADKTTDSTVM